LIRKGISKKNIFDVGSLGVENLRTIKNMNLKKIFLNLKFKNFKDNFLITYHPTTNLSKKHNMIQLINLLSVLKKFPNYNMIFTYPGSDIYSNLIIREIDNYCRNRKNAYFVKSLGSERYINLAKKCSLIIGNSSSGISEIPSIKKITINIGLRQKGRIFGNSVINAGKSTKSIHDAIKKGLKLSQDKTFCSKIFNPYGDGLTTNKVAKIIKKFI